MRYAVGTISMDWYGFRRQGTGLARNGVCMWERSMNGQEERADRANDTAARVIAYLSPYLFWAMVGAIVGGILLLQA